MLILTIIHAHRELQQQTTTTKKSVWLELLLNSTAILCARFHLSLFWCVCASFSVGKEQVIFLPVKEAAAAKQTTTTHSFSRRFSTDTFFFFFIFFRQCQWKKVKKKGKESATLAIYSSFGGTLQQNKRKLENLRAEKSTHSQT